MKIISDKDEFILTEKAKQMMHILDKIQAFKEIYGIDDFFIYLIKKVLELE